MDTETEKTVNNTIFDDVTKNQSGRGESINQIKFLDNTKIVVWKSWKILATCDEWFVDGTFNISPQLFSQVFVILSIRNGGIHPCLYTLLSNKEQTTYLRLIVEIKNLVPGIIVGSISVDFEVAIYNAFRIEFPNIEIRGCFFHLLQNLKKQLGIAGLMTDYRNDSDFNLHARMVTALAFVPPKDVVGCFEELSEILEVTYPRLQPILDWLETFYIGLLRREGVRRIPAFPIQTWNLYNRVNAGQMKTNNICEAAHRRLQAQLSMTKPTVWKFIIELKKVQAERDIYYEFLVAGNDPPPTKSFCRSQ
ncbi:uncharacterized protein LOC126904915 [Daktulosphaira vitifoliae]|uniref:uncharacterized protein LOC126904915 n=1 Tax=Daktulosphaira vitifoliae TaxID=58002 RepID=UPI0021AACC20|nr:uncharacterized protein LOC126904915 [Daktulosphaira vitifoliae]